MPRVFSGIQPTGEIHLGNYLGAVQHWVAAQERSASPDQTLYCVVDLHGLTLPWDAGSYAAATRRTAMLLLAAGLDPERCTLFVQSHVPEHTELTWLLNCIATFGELGRMTQFKEKSDGQESVSVGLFDYPVLMAADVLAYDTERVPVGDDQRQHLELARDIAIRFNHRCGDTLVVPEASIPPVGARVMDLQHPTAKMSKSLDSPHGTIKLLDDPDGDHQARQERGDRFRQRDPLRPAGEARRLEPAADPRRGDRPTGRAGRRQARRIRLRRAQDRGGRRRRRVRAPAAGALRGAGARSGRSRPHPRGGRRPRRSHRRPGAPTRARRRGPAPRGG